MFIFPGLTWVISTILIHRYCNPFYSNLHPLNCEDILRKLPRTIFQESGNISINETFINLLQQNSTKNVGGRGEEEESRYHQVQLSTKNYLRRSSSQLRRGDAAIWPKHRMIRGAMKKKMMELPRKFASSPG